MRIIYQIGVLKRLDEGESQKEGIRLDFHRFLALGFGAL